MGANQQQSPQSIKDLVTNIAQDTKRASQYLRTISPESIDSVLKSLADQLQKNSALIIEANKQDILAAEQKGLSEAMIDRLRLDRERIQSIADGVTNIAGLDNPTGQILWESERPNGLKIKRISVPIGVLGMIYESRPNVTIDAAALCLKSNNAVLLRGGSESLNSSVALHHIIQETLKDHDFPKACVSMIPMSDREAVGYMLQAHRDIDVMIPRGGKGLIERVMREATMPVFGHLEGLCHIYIDKSTDPEIAKTVPLNAKMRRTGICGAMETLLLDQALPSSLQKEILAILLDAGCELVGDADIQLLDERIEPVSEADWRTEYLSAKLSCKLVDGVEEAVQHIDIYGSNHTDSILAQDQRVLDYFIQNVDSGIVMQNTSTQFADGGEFGMGAEIGIATGKMHARGPVGLEQLCTYKYIVEGQGQIRP